MIYVDDLYKTKIGKLGRMKMSHMIADTKEELLAMAEKIGIDPKWIQKENTHQEHFDISLQKRSKAIELGAIEITYRELANKCLLRLS